MCIITGIDETNYEYYMPFMPDTLSQWIEDGEDILIFGIESFDMAAGAIVIRMVFPEAQLLWLYVDERLRGRGIGSDALIRIMEIMKDGYDMRLLSVDLYAGTDKQLASLFDVYPVTKEELFQSSYETTLGWLLSSPKLNGKSKNSISLLELDNKGLRLLNDNLIKRKLDLVRMPIVPGDYMSQSAVYMEGEQAKGVFLLKKDGEVVEISLLASFADNPISIIDMINFSAGRMNRFSEETRVFMNVVDDRILRLIKGLNSMDENDNEGFTKSERITVDLSYIDEARRKAELIMSTWKELEPGLYE